METRDIVSRKVSSAHKDLENSAKYEKHVWASKETLLSHLKTNPFNSGPDKVTTSGVKACYKIMLGLFQDLEQGNKMFQNLWKLRFLQNRKVFIHQVPSKIKTLK